MDNKLVCVKCGTEISSNKVVKVCTRKHCGSIQFHLKPKIQKIQEHPTWINNLLKLDDEED